MKFANGRFLGVVFACLFCVSVQAQSVKDRLFLDANNALETAKGVQADLLAPRSFKKGMDAYNEAADLFERGRDLNTIKSELAVAIENFGKATKATELAGVTMASLLKTRADATNADAKKFAPQLWADAETRFESIASDVERGRIKSATRKLGDAESAYREAELSAIKANYLDETKALLARADKQRVSRYAPKTLSRSKELLAEAEKELTENRYDTDRPRSLAQAAKYEVNHAFYLASVLEKIRDKEMTNEELILQWEKPVQRIAATADLAAQFDQGYDNPTQEVVTYIEDLQKEKQNLEQDLQDRAQQISQMEVEIAELERLLGGVSEERVALRKRLEAQALARQKFTQVEEMFNRDEANVFRDSNNVIMRLVGLNFDSGKSEIKPDNFTLLTKVQSAIRIFPRSALIVEGHTDSYGGDETNMRLSEERAEAVRQYLLANMNISPTKVKSIGFGETKPIGNNETPEGRTKNRRIDIVIIPAALDGV